MLTLTQSLERVFVTSDTHFSHDRIIEYASRPFANVGEMDKALIENWNSVVGKHDLIFHLGDFGWGNQSRNRSILGHLNGEIRFVRGNHDHGHPAAKTPPDLIELKTQGRMWVLAHYAMRVWNQSHRGAIQLYGHSHGCLEDDPKLQSMDVGVDSIAMILSNGGPRKPEDYKPVSLAWIVEHMANVKEPWSPPF